MSQPFLWAISENLPVKVLAVIGAFFLGGLLGGWLVGVLVKFAFNQRLPYWLTWTMRLLSGIVVGWIAWLCLFGSGGGGLGGSGVGMGGGTGTEHERPADKAKDGKRDKTPDPVIPPKQKDPDEKSKPESPGIGVGETMRVEVLGDGPLKTLAGEGKPDLERRYRVGDGAKSLRTLGEVQTLIKERRSQSPPLRKLDVVIYLDSPARPSLPVAVLFDWAEDFDPGVGERLVVEPKYPQKRAPLKWSPEP